MHRSQQLQVSSLYHIRIQSLKCFMILPRGGRISRCHQRNNQQPTLWITLCAGTAFSHTWEGLFWRYRRICLGCFTEKQQQATRRRLLLPQTLRNIMLVLVNSKLPCWFMVEMIAGGDSNWLRCWGVSLGFGVTVTVHLAAHGLQVCCFLFSTVLPGFERNRFMNKFFQTPQIFPQPLPIDSWPGPRKPNKPHVFGRWIRTAPLPMIWLWERRLAGCCELRWVKKSLENVHIFLI